MANSTPGKWQQSGSIIYSENGVICELSEIRKGTTINHQPIDIGSPDWDEAMANGRIIIAAPELLAACKALIAYRDAAGPLNFQLEKADDFINGIRAAVDVT